MVEIAISVAAKVVEFLVGPIARPFSYIWNYKTNFDNLKTEVRKLEGQKETVQDSVDLARRNGDQIKQRVSDWLGRVETITDEASEIIEENQQANMKCFKRLCPNPKRHYQHSRKAVKKAKAIVELCADGNFQTVSFRTIPEETWIPSYKGYMVFESRMSTLKNILDALSNPDVNMVGIYGTGGIGKTTLAREIGKHAEDKKLFNAVAFAEVAVKPDIKNIQQDIADKLGLTFRDENPSGRARHLQQRLKQEEKILLVLDNIWERLNLEDVGIPFGNDHKGCKLLLTARNLDVLSKMDSQKNFVVGFLDKGEAWSLFEKKAGSCDHLQALAKNVAEACGGLPIAIDSVAVALKTKEEFEWKDALRKLTTPSSSNFEGVAAETYSSIEISYSQLKERELKSTFLLCCIMEYTNVEDLLGYGMGLGIFEYVEAIEDARNRVNTLVRKLKDSSLLLDVDNNNGKFSLHDVVRDVGRSIASRDGHMFTVTNNYIPREWVDEDILKNCVGILLYNISKLPEEFECPELQFFYLRSSFLDYCRVPDNFFARMPKLKVLHLAGLELNSVLNSIHLLVNLRTLYIYDCKLRDVDFIGEFKQLKILRIRTSFGFEIASILKKMYNLTGLRLLDLDSYSILINIPPNVLSTFTQLEELYFPIDNFGRCEIKREVERVNILDELKHLKHLNVLKIQIPDDSVLPKGRLVSNKLERYNIIIGNCNWYFHTRYREDYKQTSSRMVKLDLRTSSCSDDVQKFFSLMDSEGFPELEHLHVVHSPCFRTVVDCLESESCHHFLFLQSLSLHSVLNLEMIHNYPLKADSFRQLRTITVEMCNKLKNILSFSTYRALPLLQEVNVSACDNMEEIFAIRREEEINNNEGIDQIEFKHLRTISVRFCHKLKNIFSFSTYRALPLLQGVNVSSCENMEEIFAINRREEDINNDEGIDQIEFKHLRTITVAKCNKLKNILSFSSYRALPLLQKVDVSDCDNIEEIFAIRRKEDINNIEGTDQIEFKHLSSLKLNNLPKLTSFCSINNNKDMLDTPNLLLNQKVSFSSLEVIEISKMDGLETIWSNQLCNDSFCNLKSLRVTTCNKLLTIFQSNMLKRILRLESLTIRDCDLVEEIFDLQGVDFEELPPPKETLLRELDIYDLPKLKHIWNKDPQKMFSFQKLNNVKVRHCKSLKYLFPVSIAESLSELEQLAVFNCGVEEIVAGDQGEAKVAATFVFPQLTSLKLKYLPQLKTFYRGIHASQWPNLKRLVMCGCDKVELFASELFNFQENNEGQHGSSIQPLFIVEKVTFPSLEEIEISESNNLKILWQKGAKESFCSLKSVEVSYCNELLTIFQFNTLEGLSMPKLLTVTIGDCASIEENFDLQKVNLEESHSRAVMYHQLQQLNINRLPKLKHIWKKDPQAKLSFEELPMPKSLKVMHCDSIEEIFDLQKVNFEESHSRPLTNQLQELDISGLPKLKHIWKKDPQAKLSFEELLMPKSLKVTDCKSIEEIFDLQKVNFEESHSRAVMYRLQELNLEGLPKLKHIWNKDPRVELSSESLQQVKVSGCQSLKDLFPASIARNLSQLVQLNVDRCGKLEEIVAKEGEAKEAARFVFPKVTSIVLNRLPQLRTFYRGVHSSKWEVLKKLEVCYCDKIELLASQLSCFQESNIEESSIDISVQPPFFFVEKDSFPILEKLILMGEGPWMILQGQFSEELFCNLKFLNVYNDKSEFLPLRILQRFRHLHQLYLQSSSYKEIFWYEEDETHVGVDSKLDMVLSKLESLTVGECQNLIQLVPSSTSFQNLTVLKVWRCDGLKNLMMSSTAKRLVQLREMAIRSCKSMIDVVAKGGDVTEDKIIFSKLRTLTLGDLPSLSCFCSENYTFELPSLEEIIVYKCPEMKYFSLGDITTPILQKVKRDYVDYTLEGDLNTTIQKTHNSRVDDSRDQTMELLLKGTNDYRHILSSPTALEGGLNTAIHNSRVDLYREQGKKHYISSPTVSDILAADDDFDYDEYDDEFEDTMKLLMIQ